MCSIRNDYDLWEPTVEDDVSIGANATQLTDALSNLPMTATPHCPEGRTHAFHQYTVMVEDRAATIDTLESENIGHGVYYPRTIPSQPAYGGVTVDVPIAEKMDTTVLSLPVHPTVNESDIVAIVDAVEREARR